jgi:hypothetical protein
MSYEVLEISSMFVWLVADGWLGLAEKLEAR